MIEFAIVVILLITLLYGIITYGLILAAQATVTQAAADAARSGLVLGSATTTCGTNNVTSVSSAGCTAVAQANTDVGWMDKGTCKQVVDSGAGAGPQTTTSSTGPITCTAVKESCPSNSAIQCLAVTVSYNYSSNPLFPELPGLGLITPSTISSTNVIQLGSVS